jgi:hypothetical protein
LAAVVQARILLGDIVLKNFRQFRWATNHASREEEPPAAAGESSAPVLLKIYSSTDAGAITGAEAWFLMNFETSAAVGATAFEWSLPKWVVCAVCMWVPSVLVFHMTMQAWFHGHVPTPVQPASCATDLL